MNKKIPKKGYRVLAIVWTLAAASMAVAVVRRLPGQNMAGGRAEFGLAAAAGGQRRGRAELLEDLSAHSGGCSGVRPQSQFGGE